MAMERIVRAFINGNRAKHAKYYTDGVGYFLYDVGSIAQRYVGVTEDNTIKIHIIVTLKGSVFETTCKHLNEIAKQHGAPDNFQIKKGKPFYNGTEINPYGFINITTIRDTKVSPLA